MAIFGVIRVKGLLLSVSDAGLRRVSVHSGTAVVDVALVVVEGRVVVVEVGAFADDYGCFSLTGLAHEDATNLGVG